MSDDTVAERTASALERIASSLEKVSTSLQSMERFGRISKWYDQFLRLTVSVSPESVETMKTQVLEAVPRFHLEEKSKGLDPSQLETWMKKLVFFQRVYEYLFATTSYSEWPRVLFAESQEEKVLLESLRDEEYSVLHWIHELVRDEDFRMVHLRQGEYYPKFALIIDRVLDRAAKTAMKRGEDVLSKRILAVRNWAQSSLAFDAHRKLDVQSEEYSKVRAFIQSKGLNPDKREDFRLAWVIYPDFKDDEIPN